MQAPTLDGMIRRGLLLNFRADPDVIQHILPAPFAPKLHNSYAIVGIFITRLDQLRPTGLPACIGIAFDNCAHQVVVRWNERDEPREGMYIPRRDTNSYAEHYAGGTLFPGEHQLADFESVDERGRISLRVRSIDDVTTVRVLAHEIDAFRPTSCFASLEEASAFNRSSGMIYSVTRDVGRMHGTKLEMDRWNVRPLEVEFIETSFFDTKKKFPAGSIIFDHALVMRDVPHRWIPQADLRIEASASKS